MGKAQAAQGAQLHKPRIAQASSGGFYTTEHRPQNRSSPPLWRSGVRKGQWFTQVH